jgi:hypothetical protein
MLGGFSLYYRMEKIIEVRFEGDSSLKEDEKLNYTRYLNRNLMGMKDDIISNRGYVRITSKKGLASNITFISKDDDLNKKVTLKLAVAPPFQY